LYKEKKDLKKMSRLEELRLKFEKNKNKTLKKIINNIEIKEEREEERWAEWKQRKLDNRKNNEERRKSKKLNAQKLKGIEKLPKWKQKKEKKYKKKYEEVYNKLNENEIYESNFTEKALEIKWKEAQEERKKRQIKNNYIGGYSYVEEAEKVRVEKEARKNEKEALKIKEKVETVYLMKPTHTNDIYKIGMTTRDVEERRKELSSGTGVIGEFELIYEVKVRDAKKLEKKLHQKFDRYRVNKKREFFKVNAIEIIKEMEKLSKEY